MLREVKRSVLFVSHFANMSGAPLLLLEIIKEFKKRSDVPFEILIVEDGEISCEFEKLAKTYIWQKKQSILPPGILMIPVQFWRRLSLKLHRLTIVNSVKNTSLVFFNTITNGQVHKKLLPLKCRFVCYVHELEAAIQIATSKEGLETVLANTQLFLACSHAVKKNLVSNHHIQENNIEVVNYSMAEVFREKTMYAAFIAAFKISHHIPADAIIIGIAASNEWRKGFDLLLPLVTVFFNLYPESNVYFIWKGFRKENHSSFFDLYDYKKFNSMGRVILLPHDGDSLNTIACFDIHLLLSREDPYPLVVLEAASFAIPTVSFANTGGSQEFIENDCGYCAPYGDLIRLSQLLHQLTTDAEKRNSMGANAQRKLQQRHEPENAMPAFMRILES